jgi:hypothetical protein
MFRLHHSDDGSDTFLQMSVLQEPHGSRHRRRHSSIVVLFKIHVHSLGFTPYSSSKCLNITVIGSLQWNVTWISLPALNCLINETVTVLPIGTSVVLTFRSYLVILYQLLNIKLEDEDICIDILFCFTNPKPIIFTETSLSALPLNVIPTFTNGKVSTSLNSSIHAFGMRL